jgi:hypothetical protein
MTGLLQAPAGRPTADCQAGLVIAVGDFHTAETFSDSLACREQRPRVITRARSTSSAHCCMCLRLSGKWAKAGCAGNCGTKRADFAALVGAVPTGTRFGSFWQLLSRA